MQRGTTMCSAEVGSGLAWPGDAEKLTSDKHSSLFGLVVSNKGEKSFMRLSPGRGSLGRK